MAFVKMLPAENKIKWIIKDGVEKVNRLFTEGVQNTVFHTEGYLEFISNTTQNIVLLWDADITKYSKLHVVMWAQDGDPGFGRAALQYPYVTYDSVSPGFGGSFTNPKFVDITFTSTDLYLNNPKAYLGRWGASNWHMNIINMWLEK